MYPYGAVLVWLRMGGGVRRMDRSGVGVLLEGIEPLGDSIEGRPRELLHVLVRLDCLLGGDFSGRQHGAQFTMDGGAALRVALGIAPNLLREFTELGVLLLPLRLCLLGLGDG